jgi:hypothetical protein
MLETVADPSPHPAITCFAGLDSNNFNNLVLISF